MGIEEKRMASLNKQTPLCVFSQSPGVLFKFLDQLSVKSRRFSVAV